MLRFALFRVDWGMSSPWSVATTRDFFPLKLRTICWYSRSVEVLCVPRILSMALTSRVALPGIRP